VLAEIKAKRVAFRRVSPFHFHRLFVDVAGETPKAYTQRLRLSRAGVMLLTTSQSVLDIALSCGFQSHEVFTRAFRKRFGMTPTAYRARGFTAPVDPIAARRHATAVQLFAPCLRLFHTIHAGPYETLQEAYAALESWIESNGLRPAGAPWEDYITDPAEFPDPKDWKTEVCWPVTRRT
jgi:AraC-like DNA-binding protein